MTDQKPETVFTPIQACDITQKHIDEAVAFAERHDRNLSNRNGADAIPVSAYQLRLLSLVVKKLAGKDVKPPAPPEKQQKPAAPKVPRHPAVKEPAAKVVGKAVPPEKKKPAADGVPLTDAQRDALKAATKLLKAGKVVTSREVAKACMWGSHNTAARHLRTLLDLGYLRQVGKAKVIALAS